MPQLRILARPQTTYISPKMVEARVSKNDDLMAARATSAAALSSDAFEAKGHIGR
jgi:hypothetical protein